MITKEKLMNMVLISAGDTYDLEKFIKYLDGCNKCKKKLKTDIEKTDRDFILRLIIQAINLKT